MNKSALKKFAIDSRNELREKVKIKALKYGVSEEHIAKEDIISSDAVFIDGKQLSVEEQKQRNKLIEEIKTKGYNQVIEEVAYTWFNRFTALRFMEVNNYLPTKVRVLSSTIEGSYEPDIIREALNIDLNIDKELVYELKISTENDAIDRLYKYLVIKQCNELGKILPFMFEKISDYTELLFPDGLLDDGSFIRKMTDTEVFPEEYWEDVEIIGWLYQYYISERKYEVFARPKSQKIQKEDIAPATQLFTPNWIVRYMVENSVGKLWQEGHPNEELKNKWEYYIEEAEQEEEVKKELEKSREESKKIKVEDIKIIDPAMGSGHILVYAFELLYDIYISEGYMKIEIPKLIIEKNLYGLDIDKRAFQLAYFALMMKGREKNERFFYEPVEVNLCYIKESNEFPKEAVKYFCSSKSLEMEKFILENDLEYLLDIFHDATEYGSIIKVENINFNLLEKRLNEIANEAPEDIFRLQYRDKILEIIPDLVKQGRIMSSKYEVMITNPPYMGSRGMNAKLKEFLKEEYPDTKADLFAVFMELDEHMVRENGYMAMINQHSWMFLSSFEKYRIRLIKGRTIDTMLHLGPRAFEEIGGEVVQSTAFVNRKISLKEYKGTYIRLVDYNNADLKKEKTVEAVKNPDVDYRYTSRVDNFEKIPGSPIAYWTSEKVINIFDNKLLNDILDVKKGMDTGLNDLYLRLWHEVSCNKIGIGLSSGEDTIKYNLKWIPYNKGGNFRKWYGNNEYLINWENDGFELKNTKANIRSPHLYFKNSITWNAVTTAPISSRYSNIGAIFDSAGSSMFPENNIYYYLAYMNSIVCSFLIGIINPTLNYGAGSIGKLPYISIINNDKINFFVNHNIQISKTDWDSFETSWDFQKHPILTHKENSTTIEKAFNNWSKFTHKQFYQLKANEEELNRIFIDIYGLEDELTPEVEDKDITISKVVEEKSEEDKKNSYTVDRKEAIQSFISYGVGCIFGRYSLDEDGLAYAGGDFDPLKYKTFPADKDNVIPVISNPYFENDIVSRFVDFVRITFGEENLSENLQYIAESIGMRANEVPRETLRRYFINNFFKDHVQTYKKRPIYWMFTSGRRKAFNALIYMHRYDRTTLAKIRTDYLHVLQSRLEGEKQSLSTMVKDAENTREKRQLEKQISDIEKDLREIKEYDEKLHHMADMMIDIDLDDGVKVNYKKFEGLVQKI